MSRKNSATDQTISSHGYRLLWKPGHPLADVRGYVYEHRIVAEEMLGRPLLPGEIVHHKDGNKLNNSPDNLEVLESTSHHMAEHRTSGKRMRNPGEPNVMVRCAYGCGQEFLRFDRNGRPREFVSGHNIRPGGGA